MRNQMAIILKQELRNIALKERENFGFTQDQMSEHLVMSTRSYCDIECGETSCGTLTTVLLLMSLPDPNVFLRDLKHKFDVLYAKEQARV
ncbi:MAG: hypothetical protein IJD10_04840 [Clostridia bacterium]|nr:hypothetical protein [Clostridia bacterium]